VNQQKSSWKNLKRQVHLRCASLRVSKGDTFNVECIALPYGRASAPSGNGIVTRTAPVSTQASNDEIVPFHRL